MNLRKLLPCLAAIAVVLCSVGVVQADAIVNGGFETGDLTGWSGGGPGAENVVTTSPYDGKFCALVSAKGNWEVLWSPLFSAAAGQVISFAYIAMADTTEYTTVSIYGPYPFGSGGMLYESIQFGTIQTLNWLVYSYQVPVTGSYDVEFYVSGDTSDQFYVDDLQVTPEPATIGLLAAGLSALMLLRKSRQQ